MSTPDSESFSHFSANSKSLKKFRFQQKMRGLLVIIAVGTPVLLGLAVYRSYKNSTNPVVAVQTPVPSDTTAPVAVTDSEVPATTSLPATDTSSSNTTTSGMPAGVTAAIDSIEKNGLKNNPYVSADTSVIPAGAVVKADRPSWVAYSGSLGSVNGTVSLKGTTKNGSITFQMVDGTWKVTGYSIDA